MSVLRRFQSFLSRFRPRPISEWLLVQYDERCIRIQAEPPGRSPWTQEIAWDSIVRIVFKAEGIGLSDGIYIFTSESPESYVIPTEANGGAELWEEILRRGLFDPGLAIEAASSTGGMFTWPPVEE